MAYIITKTSPGNEDFLMVCSSLKAIEEHAGISIHTLHYHFSREKKEDCSIKPDWRVRKTKVLKKTTTLLKNIIENT